MINTTTSEKLSTQVSEVRYRVRLEKPVSGTPQYFWVTEKLEVLVFEWKGQLKAFSSLCPHMGAQMQVDTETGKILCPWHGLAFEIQGARSCHHRYKKLTEHRVVQEGDSLIIG